jgi:hypothetical protein
MNSAFRRAQQQPERSDPRFKAPPHTDSWWRQPTDGVKAAQAERKRREARLIHIPPKTT